MPIYRVSLVWMYYSKPPSKKTPQPFAELRVFVFKDHPLTRLEINQLKKGLRAILDNLSVIIPSIYEATLKNRVGYEEHEEIDTFRGKIVTEIHGFEVEEVDYDEVAQYFMSRSGVDETIPVIPFDEPFRYVRFYDYDGGIKAEYNEWDIRESETDITSRIIAKEMIRFLQEEYFPILRELGKELEEYRIRFEEMIRKIRGGA